MQSIVIGQAYIEHYQYSCFRVRLYDLIEKNKIAINL